MCWVTSAVQQWYNPISKGRAWSVSNFGPRCGLALRAAIFWAFVRGLMHRINWQICALITETQPDPRGGVDWFWDSGPAVWHGNYSPPSRIWLQVWVLHSSMVADPYHYSQDCVPLDRAWLRSVSRSSSFLPRRRKWPVLWLIRACWTMMWHRYVSNFLSY